MPGETDPVLRLAVLDRPLDRPPRRLVDAPRAALNRLVDEGLFERRQYEEHPPRSEYILTDKGRDFFPVLMAMSAWGDRWLAGDEGPPITFKHKACDHATAAEVVCSNCGERLVYGSVRGSLGPGHPARRATPDRSRES
jgi:hypothetical protein